MAENKGRAALLLLSDDDKQRFDERWTGEPNSGCHLWLGATTNGYARFDVRRAEGRGRITVIGSHAALTIDGRPPPGKTDQRHALHSCDVRPCVNPAHLRWGNRLKNMQDMARRGRGRAGRLPYGVNPSRGRFVARAKLGRRFHYFGTYATINEAHQAALAGKAAFLAKENAE